MRLFNPSIHAFLFNFLFFGSTLLLPLSCRGAAAYPGQLPVYQKATYRDRQGFANIRTTTIGLESLHRPNVHVFGP